MVKFLIHNGASLQVRDNKGKTPLDLLGDRNLSYLTEAKDPSSSSEVASKKNKTIDINIHLVKEENVENMFHDIREYFDEKLAPKIDNNSSFLDPPSSMGSSSFIYSQAAEETNIREKSGFKAKKQKSSDKYEILSVARSNKSRFDLKSSGSKTVKEEQKVGPKSFSVISQ